jgi:three-Cys-motif partner protein
LRAIDSGAFRHLHLFEKGVREHRTLDAALRELPDSQQRRITLHPRSDFNHDLPVLLESGVVPLDRPCFAFLDPNATELGWETVARLAGYKTLIAGSDPLLQCKVELWVLVNTHQALWRLLPKDPTRYQVPPHPEILDWVMGGRDAWWDLWGAPHGGPSGLAIRYADRLRDVLGYRWAVPQLIKDPATGQPAYFMIHASDHPAAHTFMRSARRFKLRDDHLPGMAP